MATRRRTRARAASERRPAADEDQGADADEAAQPNEEATDRREEMAALARRRAAHFAHFDMDDQPGEQAGDNVHVGGDEACRLGPWSSARQLVEAREAATQARQERLKGSGAKATPDGENLGAAASWKPSRADWQKRPMVPKPLPQSLACLCVEQVANLIDCVESLVGLPQLYVSQIAKCVAARRQLSPAAWQLFVEGNPSELVIGNCTQIDEANMVQGLQAAATYRLERLELQYSGRGFGIQAAKALIDSGPLRGLTRLHLGAAYRLPAGAAERIVRAAPNLLQLSLPNCKSLGGSEVAAVAEAAPRLQHLDLVGCGGVERAALVAALAALTALQDLHLDEIPAVDDDVLKAATRQSLLALSLRRCAGVSDAGVCALLAGCPRLRDLDISETGLTDTALEAVAKEVPGLTRLALRRCRGVKTEAPVVAVAANGKLRRLDVALVKPIGQHLLLELAQCCSASLQVVDMSFCRGVPAAAVGHLLDACRMLDRLYVFGCTQLTRACLQGHLNGRVRIVGEPTYEAEKRRLQDQEDEGRGKVGKQVVTGRLRAQDEAGQDNSSNDDDADSMEAI